MPHARIEYSANLENEIDMVRLCEAIRAELAASPVFETGGIRVRAYPAAQYAIGDGDDRNAFVHLQLRVGAGREADALKQAGEPIFALLQRFFAQRLAEPYFALSFEIAEIHPVLTWKANNLHGRLRAGGQEGGVDQA